MGRGRSGFLINGPIARRAGIIYVELSASERIAAVVKELKALDPTVQKIGHAQFPLKKPPESGLKMRFSDQPWIVRLVSVALLILVGWAVYETTSTIADGLPMGAVIAIDIVVFGLIVGGLLYDRSVRRRRLERSGRDGHIGRTDHRR